VLIYVHIIAVTLIASYRTGLKITAWHSLLFFVVVYAERASILPFREPLLSTLPGRPDFGIVAIASVGAMWTIALATAAVAALNERELRTQKIDLEQLSAMVGEIDRCTSADEISRTLLDAVCETFAFPRGIVLASQQDEPEIVALRGSDVSARIRPGLDPLMEKAWRSRETVLAKTFDPNENPRLAEAIPHGRNMMLVPLFIEGDNRLGLMVVECGASVDHMKRWVVTIVEQFASHAALSLSNAWLLDRLELRLQENRALQSQLLSQNLALEARVEERTRELRESLEDLRAANMERQRLLARVVGAEEEERRRVANDIHDGPIQEIIVAGMKLHKLRKRLVDPDVVDIVDSVGASVDRSVEGLRGLLSELRPEVLDRVGLASALNQLIASFDGGPVIALENDLTREPSPEVRLALYRIAQEALNNIRKHAEASSVTVSLSDRDGQVRLQIEDNGIGFDPSVMLRVNPGHLGLSSMRERAHMAGGECRVQSLPTGGTAVQAWLPAAASTPEHGTEARRVA
jgi:signal transduction histidine kinase